MLMAATTSAQTMKNYGFKDFDHIDINAASEITITQGKKYEVKIEYELPEGQEPDVSKHRNILSIKTNNNKTAHGRHYLKIHVTMPMLKVLVTNGAVNLRLNKMETNNLIIKSNGAADIEIEKLHCDNISLNQNGAADIDGIIHCKGKTLINTNGAGDYSLNIFASEFDLNTNGASEVEASFKGKTCSINGNGSSTIQLTTECESLSCESYGSSTITIKGTADITKVKSRGASKINTSRLNQF